MSDLRSSLVNVLGKTGDEMVMEYVASVLEDDSFEWGHEGEGAYDAVGEFLATPLFHHTRPILTRSMAAS